MGSSRRLSKRKRGFTLFEMMVSIGIMAIIAAIAVPPWHNYQTRVRAYEAANNLRSDLQYLFSLSQQKESSYRLSYSAGSNSYSIRRYSMSTASQKGVGDGALSNTNIKDVSLADARVNLGSTDFTLTTTQQGWVAETTVPEKQVNGFKANVITVDVPGLLQIPIRVYKNGKVEVG